MENISRTATTITKSETPASLSELAKEQEMLRTITPAELLTYRAAHSISLAGEHIEFDGTISLIDSTPAGRTRITITANGDQIAIPVSMGRNCPFVAVGDRVRGSYSIIDGEIDPFRGTFKLEAL